MPPVPRTEFRSLSSVALASALLLALTLVAGWIVPQVRQAPSALAMATVAQAPAADSDAPRNGLSQRRLQAAGPNWGELTLAQQSVLQPLEKRWPFMGEVQKSRWIVLAGTFDTLPAQEQLKLRDRMESWASLSAQQRSQARLNYALTNRMAPKDKWAQWEAYQALSDEQRRALAARAAAARPAGAAPALRPVPAKKLARVPAATATANNVANLPKIPAPSAQSTHHIAPPAPPALAVETRPVSMPNVVETAPVNLSTATALPLPALAPAGADTAAGTGLGDPLPP
ncbi:DUF3106 domain-containing protein [Pantoea sp. 18069]|uniref:DUF3106 domain-containing protein n=1 Tax=Pantoea sp. 18069 TaxID=2681415 RepID=UPI0013585D7C|nr:DUF3106 domain-containing protein [Pantoea sp. 18069]